MTKIKIILNPIFILLFNINSWSQVNVQVYIKDYCTDSTFNFNGELIDKKGTVHTKNIASGYFELKIDTGYLVSSVVKRNNSSYLINKSFNVTCKDSVNIKLELYKLQKGSFDNFYDSKFYFCEKLCNGCVEDYYDNGKIRIKGYFKNGIPYGDLIYYNKIGIINKVEKYNKKGKLRKTLYK